MSTRRGVFSWCLYDWANSAFILTVVTGFFPLFFNSYYTGSNVSVVQTTAWLGFANTTAGIAIAVLSLVLGALADFLGGKKRFLAIFLALGALSTAALFFVAQGAWLPAIALFILGNIGFSCSNLFYDSLLVDISEEKDMDFISSMGFAFGYIGGVILFVFCMWMMSSPARFGLAGEAEAVKLSFLCVAVWWAVFSVPLFLFVKETRRSKVPHPAANLFASVINLVMSLRAIGRTFIAIVKNPTLLLFLCAYWLYFDGVNTFIRMAVDFGLSIGFEPHALMVALVVVQIIAFPSSLLFGYLSPKVGTGRMIAAGVVIYILVSGVGSFFMRNEMHFTILAGITGIAQGGIQALSRSYFGKLIPPQEATEYFSFYNIVSRFAVIGPMMVGVVAVLARGMGAPEMLASRIGMSSVCLFFISGLSLLMLAEKARKRSLVK
jgi:UMF1 family MFS transporter